MPRINHLNITNLSPIPSPHEILNVLPLNPAQTQFIENSRKKICDILDKKDSRYLLIVGPCSIHDIKAAKDYAIRLRQFANSIADVFHVVMRVYFEKPRTTLGWKGMLNDPWLNGSHDIPAGIIQSRQLLLELADIGIPAASEFLEPISAYYYGDLISWSCIGARTASSQIHRQLASGLPMPTAFKNSTDGSVESAINGILSASTPHTCMGLNMQGNPCTIRTNGNPYGHLVLRGGESQPNYDPQSISYALSRLHRAGLPQQLFIDCSHDNSMRQHEGQAIVFQSVINQVLEGNQNIRGFLLESNIHAGNQSLTANLSQLKYGVSLTDPCLDWESTERLINWGYSLLKSENNRQILDNDLEDNCPLIPRSKCE